MKKRLDKLMVELDLAPTRSQAIQLIKQGLVTVNGKVEEKAGAQVDENAKIKVQGGSTKWVSRAGTKLEHALNQWKIDPTNWTCLDIGASTGGFTDVLVTNGAKKVYAVDVGTGQLAPKLQKDKRVINLEKLDARNLNEKYMRELVDFICIDVSFISLTLIIPPVIKFLKPEGTLIALIKPQFEVGKENLGKGGIVKDDDLQEQAVEKINILAKKLKLNIVEVIDSPIIGKEGNKEFLIYLKK
jgi:23S rRNA (cytidine1920-2'-O)/16S rRNA (cytidine1409-2'-O)-methyltransferase